MATKKMEKYRTSHTIAMTEMVVKLPVELPSTLALVTKQIKEGISSESIFDEVLYYLTRCDAEKLVTVSSLVGRRTGIVR